MSRTATPFLEGGDFFEAPRWHGGRWWVSDFYRHEVVSVSIHGAARHEVHVPGQPSGLGWLPDGDLLVVSMLDQCVLRVGPAGTAVHADLRDLARGPLNDMIVLPSGDAYVGCFGFDIEGGEPAAPGLLLRVAADGAASVAADELWFPNGTVALQDRLVVAEYLAGRLTSFRVAGDGSLGDRRTFLLLDGGLEVGADGPAAPSAMAPDGVAVDADGSVWIADPRRRRCILLQEGGVALDEVLAPDGLAVFACALGGEGGRTLLLCCAPGHGRGMAGAGGGVLATASVRIGAVGC